VAIEWPWPLSSATATYPSSLSHSSGNSQNSSELPTLFGSFELVGKTRVHLAWPASNNNKSETLFDVIKYLIYGTVYYINIFYKFIFAEH
jgi:hypothetical protein